MILKVLENDSQFYYKMTDKPYDAPLVGVSMLVCLCKGVTDRKIRWLVQNGAASVKSVMKTCGAGSDCGTCLGQVRELVDETRHECDAAKCNVAGAAGE